jgi:Transposase DDE domain
VFRTRLLVNDADEAVLRSTLERAVEVGLFPKRVLGIVDSTGVMGADAVAHTFSLLRQAIAKLSSEAGHRLTKRLRRQVNRVCVNKARIDWADAQACRTHLGELVDLAKTVLAATAGDYELAEARGLLEPVIDQDIDEEPTDGVGPAIRQGVAPDRVVSVVDPEMRHGRKSHSSRVDGYKAHVLTDHDSELILGVAVTAANDPDGPEAAPLVVSARQAGVGVVEVLGDTAYGDGDPGWPWRPPGPR